MLFNYVFGRFISFFRIGPPVQKKHMQLIYISPSVLPSRSANSVHVVQQCDAFNQLGVKITLFAKRSIPNRKHAMEAIRRTYGVQLDHTQLISYYARHTIGENIGICMQSLRHLLGHQKKRLILSRNLYVSFLLSVLKRQPLIFETHQLEYGFRRYLQLATMIQPHVTTVVISKCLLEILTQHHGRSPVKPLVLHDAAPQGIQPLPLKTKPWVFKRLFPEIELEGYRASIGYFGHLYAGRGIHLIKQLAYKHPQAIFMIFGGNAKDIALHKRDKNPSNIKFLGHVPYEVAQMGMRACDVLLMPYQDGVSIGVKGHDTGRWMSPLKMFEYLASGTPIISSDLPPLREVLTHNVNALLVPPTDAQAWSTALDKLLDNATFASTIGRQGHATYVARHTWMKRATAILEAVE